MKKLLFFAALFLSLNAHSAGSEFNDDKALLQSIQASSPSVLEVTVGFLHNRGLDVTQENINTYINSEGESAQTFLFLVGLQSSCKVCLKLIFSHFDGKVITMDKAKRYLESEQARADFEKL
jgi:hypothetical protein